jgi:DNA replication protein DnaC
MTGPQQEQTCRTRTVTCETCNVQFEATLYDMGGERFLFSSTCSECQRKLDEEEKRQRQEDKRQQENFILEEQIPPLYLKTDRSRMDPKLLRIVDGFDLNSGQGLFISGDFGTQKTRACALLLERYCRADYPIRMIQSTVLAKHVVEQFSDDDQKREKAQKTLLSCQRIYALLIDDLGKERATERFEIELFSLIEFRTSTLRPTLYTSNLKLADLLHKFSPENGGGIVRRITEFSRRINV